MNDCNVCGRQTPYRKCNDCAVRGAKRKRADVATGELPPGVGAALDALDERVRRLEEQMHQVPALVEVARRAATKAHVEEQDRRIERLEEQMRRVPALVKVARRAEAFLLARDEDMTPRDEHAQKLGEALDALEEVETDEETMARLEANLTEARAQPAGPSEPSFYPFGTAVRVPRVGLSNGSLEAASGGRDIFSFFDRDVTFDDWSGNAERWRDSAIRLAWELHSVLTKPGHVVHGHGALAQRITEWAEKRGLTGAAEPDVTVPPSATAGEYEELLRDLDDASKSDFGIDGLLRRSAAALRKVLGERDELEQRAKTWSDAHDAAEERLRSANRTWLNRYEALEAALARLDATPAAQLPTPTPANVAAVGQLWVHPELGLCEVTAIERDADGSSRVVFGEREFCCTLASGETLFEHGLELIPDETQAERCARASRDFAVDMMGRGLSMTDDGLRYQLALLLRRTEDAGRAAERERIRVAFANCDAHCRSRMAQDIIDNVPRVNDRSGGSVSTEPTWRDAAVALLERAERTEADLAREREAHEETRKRLAWADDDKHVIADERDASRAEVERLKADEKFLRGELALAVTAPCDKCGHGKSADWKALEVEVDRLRAAAEPVLWDDAEGLGRIVWRESAKACGLPTLPYEHEPAAACQAAGAAVASALARALLTEDTLDAFVGAVIREPDRDLTNLVTTGAGMRAALAHAGANVAAEPVAAEPAAEGRPCPVDVHEVGWEAECGLGYEVVEGIRVPDLHEVNLMAQVILWLVDEVRRLGGGGK